VDRHGAVSPHRVYDQVFHVARWESLGEVLHESDEAILAQHPIERLHGVIHLRLS
jgi:hypothetical protein